MSIRRRYTVVTDKDAELFLLNHMAATPSVMQDVVALDRELSFSPQAAGQLKSSGYYLARRGSIEVKYHVSDEDRRVRIIGARRCAHPFDVVLSDEVTRRLLSYKKTPEGKLAFQAIRFWTPRLRRDPRLVGQRIENGSYRDEWGRVSLRFEISELDCRLTIISIEVI